MQGRNECETSFFLLSYVTILHDCQLAKEVKKVMDYKVCNKEFFFVKKQKHKLCYDFKIGNSECIYWL